MQTRFIRGLAVFNIVVCRQIHPDFPNFEYLLLVLDASCAYVYVVAKFNDVLLLLYL